MARAARSVPPPAPKPINIVIGRVGKSIGLGAGHPAAARPTNRPTTKIETSNLLFISLPPFSYFSKY